MTLLDLSVILFSRFNGLAQGFRFCISTDEPSIPISVSDPFIFPIPDIVYDVHQPKNNGKSDRFSHILLKESGNLETSHETVHPESAVIKFIGETTDLKLVEAFNCLSFDDQPRQANSSQNNSIVPRKSLRSKIKSSYRVDDVNFVVEDMEDLGTRSNPQTEQTRVLPGPLYRSPELPERIEPWMSWHTYVFHGSPETLSDIDVKSHQIQSFDDWIGPAIIGLQSRVFDGKTFMTCQTL